MRPELERFALAMLIRPFVALVVFLIAAYVARLILRFIPNGKVKSFLTRRVGS